MEGQFFDCCFDFLDPGACLTKLHFYIKSGVIVKCEIRGACLGNLKVLEDLLTGEDLRTADKCLSEICGGSNSACVLALKSVMRGHLEKIKESVFL